MKTAYRGEGALYRDTINVLDCAFCGEWFPTFERLAKHVYARHTGAAISGAPISRRQHPTMAKKTRKPAKPVNRTRGGIPAPSADDGSSGDFNPFLKADHVGKRVGATAKLKIAGEAPRVVDGNFGEQIIVPVSLNGKRYDLAITIDSVNHRLMFERFGANPAAWRGSVNVEVKMSRQDRPYIAVVR